MIPLFLTVGLGAAAVLAQNSTKTCTIPSKYASSNGADDDSAAINAAFEDCRTGGTVVFSEGVDYNVHQPINATGLKDVEIHLYGNLHVEKDIETTREIVTSSSASTFYWFTFAGENIHLIGAKDIRNGWINSYGQQWWDANPAGGTGISGRPHLMLFDAKGGSIIRHRSRKPVAWNVKVLGSDIDIEDCIVDAVSDKWESFPFNTDAFGIAAKNVRIKNLVAYNGDDAVAINNGAENVCFGLDYWLSDAR